MTWREELAWAAGFFDGEGHTGTVAGRTPGAGRQIRMTINQVDREVLERFQSAVLGLGTISGPQPSNNPAWQPMYRFSITKGRHVQAAIAMLWPFLGSIKRAQAAEALKVASWHKGFYSPVVPDDDRTCRRGHPYPGNRTRYNQCRPCMRLSDSRRRT